MLDIVKISWENAQGYWIPAAWLLVVSNNDDEAIRSSARIGRPSMKGMKVLDRITIPEELRATGQARRLMSQVILYTGETDDLTAAEFLARMEATYA